MTPYYVGVLWKGKKCSFPSVEGEKIIFRKKQQIWTWSIFGYFTKDTPETYIDINIDIYVFSICLQSFVYHCGHKFAPKSSCDVDNSQEKVYILMSRTKFAL